MLHEKHGLIHHSQGGSKTRLEFYHALDKLVLGGHLMILGDHRQELVGFRQFLRVGEYNEDVVGRPSLMGKHT